MATGKPKRPNQRRKRSRKLRREAGAVTSTRKARRQQRQRALVRPRAAPSNIPAATIQIPSSTIPTSTTPASDSADPKVSMLQQTQILLQQLHVRNRNQHRTQKWWRQFQLLRRALRNQLSLHLELESIRSTALQSKSAKEVRAGFERETVLKSQIDEIETWIRNVVVPKCWVGFSTVVADLQFAKLGLVLLGILGELAAQLGLPVSQSDEEEKGLGSQSAQEGRVRSFVGRSVNATGEDRGVVVERVYDFEAATNDEDAAGSSDLAIPVQRDSGQDQDMAETTEFSNRTATAVTALPDRQDSTLAADGKLDSSAVEKQAKKSTVKKKTQKKKNAIDDLFGGLV